MENINVEEKGKRAWNKVQNEIRKLWEYNKMKVFKNTLDE